MNSKSNFFEKYSNSVKYSHNVDSNSAYSMYVWYRFIIFWGNYSNRFSETSCPITMMLITHNECIQVFWKEATSGKLELFRVWLASCAASAVHWIKTTTIYGLFGGFGGAFWNLKPPMDPPESLYEFIEIIQRCSPKKKLSYRR